MKKTSLFAALVVFTLFACNDTNTPVDSQQQPGIRAVNGLALSLEANPEWEYENLRLYPVLATADRQQADAVIPTLKTLAEAMQIPGFRITERKQFGRSPDNWYNALTVQNKSQDTVFLLSGDVVTGGNQDRVIAYDDIIPPGTVKNIEVFCVEAGRSSYYNPEAPEAEKRVAAFRGYYNVASPQVRMAVNSGNQQGVWRAVEQVTSANKAISATKAYAALETENEQKEQREAYLRFFDQKLAGLENAVGMVAVCNGKVIGVDIFGQSSLFQQLYPALLHGYAAEAAVMSSPRSEPREEEVLTAFHQVAAQATKTTRVPESVGKFTYGDAWVHLYRK